jgi:AraC family transcriptional regulator of arabinose operon
MDPKIRRLIAIIENDPNQTLSLTVMGRMVGLSPSRLRHKFKSEVGVTPTVYVQNVRLKLAEALLHCENLSVKEVRAAIGLESDSYFTRLCERFFGMPPSRIKSSAQADPHQTAFSQIEQEIAT